MNRYVISYHRLPDNTYRAVVVKWSRNRFGTMDTCIDRTYTARTVRRVWWQLVFNGHIAGPLAHNAAAFNAFRMLGNATAG